MRNCTLRMVFFCQWGPKKTCTLSLGAYIVAWIAYFGKETWKLCFPKGRASIGLENFLTKHLTFLWTNILLPLNEHSKFDKWTKTNPWQKWMHVKMWFYLCKNVHPTSTKEIITKKLCKKIYGHGQCIMCVTLKLQTTLHFSHNLLGLVCSCSIVQLPFSCSPSPISLFTQAMVHMNVDFPHHSFIGDLLAYFQFSASGGDGCLFLIFLLN
jgi:hypothetical protein